MTVYVSIGNSDDRLTQREWSEFIAEVNTAIKESAAEFHGKWTSLPHAPWQNACWCIEPQASSVGVLRRRLADLGRRYRQDSIAWAEAPTTDFL